jgi:B-cell receptor-associated protein 31
MYLNGFTLFLSLILSRTYSLILDLIKSQEDLANLKLTLAGKKGGELREEEKLRNQLKALQKDYDSLSQQVGLPNGDKKKN